MAEGSREQQQEELIEVRRARNVMANHVAAAVFAGDVPRAQRLAVLWHPLWDRAIEIWVSLGDETGLKGRIES